MGNINKTIQEYLEGNKNMKSINKIIQEYLEGQKKQAELKKQLDHMKRIIVDYTGNCDSFVTNEYTVILKTSTSVRLDTETLYKDFPDIKKEYGKETISKSLVIVQVENANKKTA